ncbi:hypothetical protein ElyMa_005340200 [Elysia marginata]|uniref:Endonuclease/exonuclease/phosphatase domain-containing protein n=1 Tax=Elysia marginata TaxID=1093978 RepID=A0AAV4E9K0_9GAST|nr:hypothetical protein ElyMa_005340200 [Elysia marginata]
MEGAGTGEVQRSRSRFRYGGKFCSAINCKNVRSKTECKDISFHMFPKGVEQKQETHLKEEERFWIRGYYKDFRQDGINRKNGGIITLVNTNTLAAVETCRSRPDGETVDQDTECLGIGLILPFNNLHVNNIYSPPDKDFQFEPQVKQDNFIVVGDFNSHPPSWGDSKGEMVEDWAIDNQLVLLNRAEDPLTFTSMTWRTSSTPDIAFVTDDIQGRLERSVESQLGGSDHKPSIITIKDVTVESDNRKEPSWNFKKANWELFKQTAEMNTAQLKLSGNMQKDAKAFKQAIIDAAKVSIPRGYRNNYKPYWTPALKKLHKDLGLLKDKLIQ